MSIKLMAEVWGSGLKRSLKAVALAYADHADDDGGSIYPSVAYTAWKTGYSKRAVQQHTKELVDRGVLTRVGEGPNGTNEYRLNANKLPKRKPFHESVNGNFDKDDSGQKDTKEGGAKIAGGGCKNCTQIIR